MNVNVYYTILCLKHRKKIIEANDNPRKKYKKDLSLKEIKQIEKDLSFIVEYGEKTDDYYDDLVDIVRFYKSGYKKLYKELAPEIAQPNYKEEVALIEENKLLKKKIVVLEKQFKRDFKKNDLIKENNLLKTKIVELSDQQARDLIQFNEVRAADKREVVNNMTQDIYHTLNSDLEGFGNKIEKVVDLVNKNFKKSLKKPYRKKRSWETKDPDTIGQVINTAFDEWKQLEDRTKAMKRVFSVDPNLKSMNNIDKHMKKMLVQPKDSNLTVKCVSKNNISNLKMKIDKELWRIMLGEIISNAKKHNHKKNIDLIFEFDKDKQLNRLTIYYYNTGTPGKVKFLRRRGGLAIIKKIIELHGFSIQPRENDNNFNFEIIIPLKI
jgi:hypothetical protein